MSKLTLTKMGAFLALATAASSGAFAQTSQQLPFKPPAGAAATPQASAPAQAQAPTAAQAQGGTTAAPAATVAARAEAQRDAKAAKPEQKEPAKEIQAPVQTSAAERARITALEQLGRLDLDIEVARKRAELQRAIEQASPGYQLPTYSAIFGPEGRMRADLVSPTGNKMTVTQGDRITRGVTVSSISNDGVELSIGTGKASKRVMLDPTAPAGPGAGQAGAAPTAGIPLMPPRTPLPVSVQ